jgi:hypothetical protein
MSNFIHRPLCWSSHSRLAFCFALFLLCTLAACGGGGNNNKSPQGGAATAPVKATTQAQPTTTATPAGIQLGPQPCPPAVAQPSYWDPIIPTQPGINAVESVSCGYLMGQPALQALVTVRSQGTGAMLDVHVYNHITSPAPDEIFKLDGLYKGSAKISYYNTVLTAQVDLNSSLNKGQSGAALQPDLFREFKWSDGAGTLVPVSFPGIFPDLTRYQAENDQQQVNQGQDGWKLDAAKVASQLTITLLQWPATVTATLVSGGGQHDVDAVVNVKTPTTPAGMVQVTLSRLEGNTNGGIWIATSVTSPALAITTPSARNILTSPVTVTGRGSAFEGVIGKVIVLDHLYNAVGQAQAKGAIGNGTTTFSTTVSYTTSFKNGPQEGLLALYSYSNANGLINGAIIVKELLAA